jgi:hypothetical protein
MFFKKKFRKTFHSGWNNHDLKFLTLCIFPFLGFYPVQICVRSLPFMLSGNGALSWPHDYSTGSPDSQREVGGGGGGGLNPKGKRVFGFLIG